MAAPFTLPDRYRLTRPVASGGMASVWAAQDTMLGREVAVKVLAEHLDADLSARRRFEREARAAAGLSSHPGVVTIYDVGEHAGRSFIVMELRTGGTLADMLTRERPEAREAVQWLRDIAEALDTAHEAGIVHRDIKPANLLFDERRRIAVADFGIARIAEDDSLTQTGIVLGTASYISPEQAMGEDATPASDRYSLAVVAFELLTGSKPFEAEHFAAQARAHVESPPPAASTRAPGLSPAVDAVLCRGLAKDPADRWPSAVAFVEALADAFEDPTEPTVAVAPTRRAPVDGRFTPAAAAPARGRQAPPRRADRRSLPLLAMAAVLGVLVVAAIVLAALNAGDGGDTAGDGRAESTPTAEATREATAEPTAEATAEPQDAPADEAPDGAQEPSGGDPAQLNAEGFSRFQDEQYAEAIPYFQRAVEACGDSRALDPCGYAHYNLGASLNRAGRPAEAIPILEKRLELWDNQEGVVRKELEAARAAAGEGESGGDDDGNGKGKGKKDKD